MKPNEQLQLPANLEEITALFARVVEAAISNYLAQLSHPKEDTFLSRDETRKLLGISLVTLHTWTQQGKLSAHKIAGSSKVYYSEQDVRHLITSSKKWCAMSLDGFTISNSCRRTVLAIYDDPRLEFHAKVDLKKGLVYDYIQEASYKGLKLKVLLPPHKHKVIICGNFYQYRYRLPNTGDFPFSEFLQSVDQLCREFQLRPQETSVIKLEAGANIRTRMHPREAIDNIITYKGRQKQFKDYKGQGYDGTFTFQEYLIRLYCKSCKNKLSDPVLRVELASEKSHYLKRLGIYTLADLQKVEAHVKLGTQLLGHVRDFVYDDLELDLGKLSKDEAKVVQEYRSPLAWRNLMAESPNNYRKKKKRHQAIIEKHATINWGAWLEEALTLSMERQLGISLGPKVQLDKAA